MSATTKNTTRIDSTLPIPQVDGKPVEEVEATGDASFPPELRGWVAKQTALLVDEEYGRGTDDESWLFRQLYEK